MQNFNGESSDLLPEQTSVESYGYDDEGVPNELTGELLWPEEVPDDDPV